MRTTVISRATTVVGLASVVVALAVSVPANADQPPAPLIRASVEQGGGQRTTGSYAPAVSADGQVVAYASYDPAAERGTVNLVVDDHSTVTRYPAFRDLFQLSSDGRFLAGDRCVPVEGPDGASTDCGLGLLETATGVETAIDLRASVGAVDVSGDGRYVAYSSYGYNDLAYSGVYVWDRQAGTRRKVVSDPSAFGVSVSDDGQRVVYGVNGRLYLATGTGSPVEIAARSAEGYSHSPAISADGRTIAFSSSEPFVTADEPRADEYDYDIYAFDVATAVVSGVSVSPRSPSTDCCEYPDGPAISADGRYVAFGNDTDNLTGNDTNQVQDVYVADLATQRVTLVSRLLSAQADRDSYAPSLAGDGRFVAFASYATNLVAGDTNDTSDIFLLDRLNAPVDPTTPTTPTPPSTPPATPATVPAPTATAAVSAPPTSPSVDRACASARQALRRARETVRRLERRSSAGARRTALERAEKSVQKAQRRVRVSCR